MGSKPHQKILINNILVQKKPKQSKDFMDSSTACSKAGAGDSSAVCLKLAVCEIERVVAQARTEGHDEIHVWLQVRCAVCPPCQLSPCRITTKGGREP